MKTNIEIGPLLKRLSYGDRLHPSRDWFVLLATATVLIALSVAWNFWLLKSVEEGGTIGQEEAPERFDAAPIESIRSIFETRKNEELKYRQEYRFVDPSR
ncbi:MAG TPA: hypothetical protein PK609_00585 [Candidatus Paceibacterota bacterium]|nr:hypothetical protein [Candidatus Paceibacterota bacterium]